MSVLVVGTTALDTIRTPAETRHRLLGGSASHAAVASSFFAPTSLAGVVGSDFPEEYLGLYRRFGIDLQGLERKTGPTFHWDGEYEADMNNRSTHETVLGVIEGWKPELPPALREKTHILLANCEPRLQLHVLDQIRSPRLVIADTMDLWLNIARDDLLALLGRIDCLALNDSEARQLTEEDSLVRAVGAIHALGPENVIVKKGEHGSLLSQSGELFAAPSFPLSRLVDPTGAGDTFAGGLAGYLASRPGAFGDRLRQAVIHGTAAASFCCEGFGLNATVGISRDDIDRRVAQLGDLARF